MSSGRRRRRPGGRLGGHCDWKAAVAKQAHAEAAARRGEERVMQASVVDEQPADMQALPASQRGCLATIQVCFDVL